jgi:hypothetical protein
MSTGFAQMDSDTIDSNAAITILLVFLMPILLRKAFMILDA